MVYSKTFMIDLESEKQKKEKCNLSYIICMYDINIYK